VLGVEGLFSRASPAKEFTLADIFGSDMLSALGLDSPTPSKPARASAMRMLSWIQRAQGGIWFRRNSRQPVRFSDPHALPVDKYGDLTAILGLIGVQDDPGVYAILVGNRVLYFGESEGMTRRASSSTLPWAPSSFWRQNA